MSFLILIAGLAVLIVSGDFFVRGAVALAVRLAIPMLVVGLTIVAFGTSAPELVVSLNAALNDAPGLAIGNVIGSNIANVLLVLGVPAVLIATNCCEPYLRSNLLFVIGASLIFIAFCFSGTLVFWHGAVMFALLLGFLGLLVYRARTSGGEASVVEEAQELAEEHLSSGKTALFLIVGLIGMPLGAHFTVMGATDFARQLGVTETVIGLTVVAIGTSLPELSTTLMAVVRNKSALALGNVLGSNLFNLLAIMGITSMVTPVPVPAEVLELDVWIMLGATLLLVPFIVQRVAITRIAGIAFLTCYAVYLSFICMPSMPVSGQPTLANKTQGGTRDAAGATRTSGSTDATSVGLSYQAKP